MAAALALAASVLWGTADYAGGLLSRRYPVTVVVVLAQGIGLVGILLFTAVGPGFAATGAALGWGALSGVVGVVALGCFYAGLSTGLMGVVAPIAATGAVVPVIAGLAQGERLAPVAGAGIVIAIAGVALAARPADAAGTAGSRVALRPVVLALIAAAGFGGVFVFLAKGSADNVAMTLVAQRATSVLLAGCYGVVVRAYERVPDTGSAWAMLMVAGTFDLLANGLFAVSSRSGLVSIVGVLSSLYPVVTVLLARRLLREQLSRAQLVGVIGALVGVVLLAS